MIEAVTYGMIPSANSENCESAPPEKSVQQAEDRAALAVEVALDRVGVDAGGGNPRAEPVERQDHAP